MQSANTSNPLPTMIKWYEEPEDLDRLCPAEDDADMEDMRKRYRELYLSFLRLDKLKKMTTIKNNDQISSDQKKETQHEARRVGLLLKEYDSLWTEQGWSSARKSSGLSRKTPPAKEAQTTSTSDPVKNPRTTKTKSRKSQTDVGNSDDIPFVSTTTATADKSHMTPTCAHKAQSRRTSVCKCCNETKRKAGNSRCATGLQ